MKADATYTKGQKVTVTTELAFGKGTHTEICTVVAVLPGKVLLCNGMTVRTV